MFKFFNNPEDCVHKKTKHQASHITHTQYSEFLKRLELRLKKSRRYTDEHQFRFDVQPRENIKYGVFDSLTIRYFTKNSQVFTMSRKETRYFYMQTFRQVAISYMYRDINRIQTFLKLRVM